MMLDKEGEREHRSIGRTKAPTRKSDTQTYPVIHLTLLLLNASIYHRFITLFILSSYCKIKSGGDVVRRGMRNNRKKGCLEFL